MSSPSPPGPTSDPGSCAGPAPKTRLRALSSPRGSRIPGLSPGMRVAPNPRTLTGWFGASPRVLRVPLRAFLRFPVCPLSYSPSSAFLGLPFVRHSPVYSLWPLPGYGSPWFPPGPLPLGTSDGSAAAKRFCAHWSRPAGTKVTSSAATTSLGSRDPSPPGWIISKHLRGCAANITKARRFPSPRMNQLTG